MADAAEQRLRDIEKQTKKLNARNPADRRAAALYLGEAAAADAVPRLVELYRKDPDPRVREAAAYALGQFKAVEEAVAEGDDDIVVPLIDRIENQYELGRRANPAPLQRMALALTLTAVGFILAILLLPNGALRGQIPGLTPPSATRADVIDALAPIAQSIAGDAGTLQSVFEAVLRAEALDCQAFFNQIEPAVLAPENASAYPDLAAAAARINAQRDALNAVKARYDSACLDNPPLAGAEVGGLLSQAVAVKTDMDALSAELAQAALDAIPTVTPTAAPTDAAPTPDAAAPAAPATPDAAGPAQTAPPAETALPTETPTPAPTPTPVEISGFVSDVFSIINSVQAQRGASAQLLQYWRDAASSGRTQGCTLPQPAIPQNYVLPGDVAEAAPQLRSAVQLVNSALDSLRGAWQQFAGICANGNLRAEAQAQLSQVIAIDQQFTSATQILESLVAR
jgi:hypothetical protein